MIEGQGEAIHGRTSPRLSGESSLTGGRVPGSKANLRTLADESLPFRQAFVPWRTSHQVSDKSSLTGGRAPGTQANLRSFF